MDPLLLGGHILFRYAYIDIASPKKIPLWAFGFLY